MTDQEVVIRPLRPDEIDRLLFLCAEHAAYEKIDFTSEGKADHMLGAIFSQPVRLWCFVAEVNGAVVGYATCTKDFSTLRASEYLHLDCLHIARDYRGFGIGKKMMLAIAAHAASMGCATLEWQTPIWNEPAIRFYRRLGAIGNDKARFRWDPGQST